MRSNHLTKKVGAAIIATGLVAGGAQTAFAAVQDSVGIDLEGTVLSTVAITVTVSTVSGLVLEPGTTYPATEISVENESANLGYTVYVNSANLAATNCAVTTTPCLYNATGGDIDYNLHDWNTGTAIAFAGGAEAVWVPLSAAKFSTAPDRSVEISYTIAGGEVHVAGSYIDTLTFRIVSE
ncbi:MAG: hypothetical protein HQ495_14145 [Alphaproteobacteria bacterium]|nr:hypothetical protein [Alphaproteobacteria bacterium]